MFYDRDVLISTTSPVRSIGRKIELIPHHITKIVYRQGQGEQARPGASISCYCSCYMMDGKELLKKKNTVKKFPVGTNRLIQGLEVVFQTTRRNQKFTVIISPEYAYKNIEISQSIPRNQKLIFEFQIINIQYMQLCQKSQIQVLEDLRQLFSRLDQLYKQKRSNQALQLSKQIYTRLNPVRYVKNDILLSLVMKQAFILSSMGRHRQALTLCQQNQFLQPNNCKMMLLMAKLYRMLGQVQRAKNVLVKCNDLYSQSVQVKRIYVQFLKDMKDYAALRSLPGYNILTDQIQIVPLSQVVPPKNNNYYKY